MRTVILFVLSLAAVVEISQGADQLSKAEQVLSDQSTEYQWACKNCLVDNCDAVVDVETCQNQYCSFCQVSL